MEIYKGTVPTVTFVHPATGTAVTSITWNLNGTGDNTAAPITGVAGQTSANLGYIANGGKLAITWTFTITGTTGGPYVETETYDVVTPILSLSEIKSITGDSDDTHAANVERAVRHIIEAHCGQRFDKYVGVLNITGGGQSYLVLPRRLISFTSINSNTEAVSWLSLRGRGWYLVMPHSYGIPTIRADYDGFNESTVYGSDGSPSTVYYSGVPIVAPGRRYGHVFVENYEYAIDGVWGWEQVPNAVQEAARLLVNDYACGDSIYRDRFLNSVQAADWNFEFNPGAFAATGNVRADQLLVEYVISSRRWMVI